MFLEINIVIMYKNRGLEMPCLSTPTQFFKALFSGPIDVIEIGKKRGEGGHPWLIRAARKSAFQAVSDVYRAQRFVLFNTTMRHRSK